ncbi:MAG: hypothetical protein WCK17_07540, partial [Verrucomicrobiota bacterium]
RPSGYEPDELPGCSTPRLVRCEVVLSTLRTQGESEISVRQDVSQRSAGTAHGLVFEVQG